MNQDDSQNNPYHQPTQNENDFIVPSNEYTLTDVSNREGAKWHLSCGKTILGRDDPQNNRAGGRSGSFLTFFSATHSVSRSHAKIFIHTAGEAWVRDLGSTNGTRIIQPWQYGNSIDNLPLDFCFKSDLVAATPPIAKPDEGLSDDEENNNNNKNERNVDANQEDGARKLEYDDNNVPTTTTSRNNNNNNRGGTACQRWYQLSPGSLLVVGDIVLLFEKKFTGRQYLVRSAPRSLGSSTNLNLGANRENNSNNNMSNVPSELHQQQHVDDGSSQLVRELMTKNNSNIKNGNNNNNNANVNQNFISSTDMATVAMLASGASSGHQLTSIETNNTTGANQETLPDTKLQEDQDQTNSKKKPAAKKAGGKVTKITIKKEESPKEEKTEENHLEQDKAAVDHNHHNNNNSPKTNVNSTSATLAVTSSAATAGVRIRSRHETTAALTTSATKTKKEHNGDEVEQKDVVGPKPPFNSANDSNVQQEEEEQEEAEQEKNSKNKKKPAAKKAGGKQSGKKTQNDDDDDEEKEKEKEKQPQKNSTADEAVGKNNKNNNKNNTANPDPKVPDLESDATIVSMPSRKAIFTGYTNTEKQKLRRVIMNFGCTIEEDFTDDVNLLICKTPCDRTPKLMMAVGRGIPIVTEEFFTIITTAGSSKPVPLLSATPTVIAQEKGGNPSIVLQPAELLSILRKNKAFGPIFKDNVVNISDIGKKDTKEQVAEIVTSCGGKVLKTANQVAAAKASSGNKNNNASASFVNVTEKSIDEFYTNLLIHPRGM